MFHCLSTTLDYGVVLEYQLSSGNCHNPYLTGFLSKAQIILSPHELLSTLYVTHQFTYYIYIYILFHQEMNLN